MRSHRHVRVSAPLGREGRYPPSWQAPPAGAMASALSPADSPPPTAALRARLQEQPSERCRVGARTWYTLPQSSAMFASVDCEWPSRVRRLRNTSRAHSCHRARFITPAKAGGRPYGGTARTTTTALRRYPSGSRTLGRRQIRTFTTPAMADKYAVSPDHSDNDAAGVMRCCTALAGALALPCPACYRRLRVTWVTPLGLFMASIWKRSSSASKPSQSRSPRPSTMGTTTMCR
jgi:hypothetical protein